MVNTQNRDQYASINYNEMFDINFRLCKDRTKNQIDLLMVLNLNKSLNQLMCYEECTLNILM